MVILIFFFFLFSDSPTFCHNRQRLNESNVNATIDNIVAVIRISVSIAWQFQHKQNLNLSILKVFKSHEMDIVHVTCVCRWENAYFNLKVTILHWISHLVHFVCRTSFRTANSLKFTGAKLLLTTLYFYGYDQVISFAVSILEFQALWNLNAIFFVLLLLFLVLCR